MLLALFVFNQIKLLPCIGDKGFPELNEIGWDTKMKSGRKLSYARKIVEHGHCSYQHMLFAGVGL